jgi:hypothetical protein
VVSLARQLYLQQCRWYLCQGNYIYNSVGGKATITAVKWSLSGNATTFTTVYSRWYLWQGNYIYNSIDGISGKETIFTTVQAVSLARQLYLQQCRWYLWKGNYIYNCVGGISVKATIFTTV